MIIGERQLGAAMPPAVTTLFQLYPGLKSGFDWINVTNSSSMSWSRIFSSRETS